jgi:hypothetical protein
MTYASRSARIAFVGPPGSGKTTCAIFSQRIASPAAIISVAQPLRDTETFLYQLMGKPSPASLNTQDGTLLQDIRELLELRSPGFLETFFARRIEALPPDSAIFNDDCRIAMHGRLSRLGFQFVRVHGARLDDRHDITPARPTGRSHDGIIPDDLCNVHIDNSGTPEALMRQLRALLYGGGERL